MAKAFAYIANTTSQTVTGGGAINAGAAVHGFGCTNGARTIQVSNGNIVLSGCGYYAITVGATVTDSAAGNVTLSVYQDGVLVAQGSEAIAAASDPASISVPVGVKVGCGTSTITLVVTVSAGDPTVTAVYTTVLKA